MKVAFICLAILSLSSASPASEFFNGLVTGLEANPASIGTCGNDLLKIATSLSELYLDGVNTMNKQVGAFTDLVLGLQSFEELFVSFSDSCSFTEFFQELTSFATSEGRKLLFKNYMNNVVLIDNSMYNVENCAKNFQTCGNSLGVVIRTLTGATLNSPKKLRSNVQGTPSGLVNFFKGIMTTYVSEQSTTALCKGNVLRLMPAFEQIVHDLAYGSKEARDLALSSVEFTVIETCWETDWKNFYSVKALDNYFKVLANVKAWQLSYFMNTQVMNTYFGEIAKCSENYFNCGAAFVKFAPLVAPWVNYS